MVLSLDVFWKAWKAIFRPVTLVVNELVLVRIKIIFKNNNNFKKILLFSDVAVSQLRQLAIVVEFSNYGNSGEFIAF